MEGRDVEARDEARRGAVLAAADEVDLILATLEHFQRLALLRAPGSGLLRGVLLSKRQTLPIVKKQ